jgi:hypothetical protein
MLLIPETDDAAMVKKAASVDRVLDARRISYSLLTRGANC